MKIINSIKLFFVFILISTSFANFIPSQTPKTISLLILAPGNKFDSSFGHVDLMLSYGDQPKLNDVLVGFGPAKVDPSSSIEDNIMGYEMIQWSNTLLDRFIDARDLGRKWLRVVPIKLNEEERTRLVYALEWYHDHLSEIRYYPLNNNCASMVSHAIEYAVDRRISGIQSNYPLTIESTMKRKGLASWFNNYQYSQNLIIDTLQNLGLP